MTPNLTLVIVVGVLTAVGVYLLLARSVVRALMGFLLLSNGANVLFLVASGEAGLAPIVGDNAWDEMSDPLPQAMVLTAIVITLGMTAFLLALAHRAWQISETDVLENDPEDARIKQMAVGNDMSGSDYGGDNDDTPDDVGEQAPLDHEDLAAVEQQDTEGEYPAAEHRTTAPTDGRRSPRGHQPPNGEGER